jgi:hypothetical protein
MAFAEMSICVETPDGKFQVCWNDGTSVTNTFELSLCYLFGPIDLPFVDGFL